MPRHSIELSPELEAQAAARAAAAGYASVEEYLRSLLLADVAGAGPDAAGAGTDDTLRFEDDGPVESPLLDHVEDDRPSVEATPEFWADFDRRLTERHAKPGGS
jgi:hypothetical protein